MPPSDLEHWDQRYRNESPPPWDTGRPSKELQRRLAELDLPKGTALELGCGTGTNAVWLAEQGFDVTGLDVSPTAIERARQLAEVHRVAVRFLAADIVSPPDLGDAFDLVFDRGCYHAVRRANAEAYLSALRKFTRSGTTAIVLTGNSREPRKPGPPTMSELEIRNEFGRDWEIVHLDEFRFDQDEPDGQCHLGWSVVLSRR